MSPDKAVEDVLLANVTPLTGVYPLEVPAGKSTPYVLLLQHQNSGQDALDGGTGLMECMIELNAIGNSYAQMVALAGRMVSSIRSMQGTTYDDLCVEQCEIRQESPDLKEKDVGLYRRMYSLRMKYQKEE